MTLSFRHPAIAWLGIFLLIAGLAAAPAASAQFWGAHAARPFGTPADSLQKGDFVWAPELSPQGPILVLVSLTEQLAYTYRNGVLIGMAKVSTGKPGHETPTGIFITTLKDANHHSSKYNNAAMPYTQRFTNSGIALHAGGLPGYPSSHGCVHLPSVFAKDLFAVSPMGMTVVVAKSTRSPREWAFPSALSPVAPAGKTAPHNKLAPNETYRWQPELSPEGPASLLISRADQRLIVLRNGIEIGRCKIAFAQGPDSVGTQVYIAQHGTAQGGPGRWLAYAFAPSSGSAPVDPFQQGHIRIPDAFMQELGMLVAPGTTLVVTDAPLLPATSGQSLTLLTSHPES